MSEDITKNEVVSNAVEADNISEEKRADLVSETQVQGAEAGEVASAGIEEARANAENADGTKAVKTKRLKIILGSAAAVVVLIIAALLLPNMLTSVDDLCARGEYQKAYAKASDEVKLQVKAESIAAERCAYSAENLKDPSSFNLRAAYYNENYGSSGLTGQLVLYISGKNSYGGTVSSYWLYTWDNDDREWSYFCSVSSLEDEEYKSYDDTDDRLEKLVNNLGRLSIKNTMTGGLKLDKNAIGRINALFENGILDNVVPIDMMDGAST